MIDVRDVSVRLGGREVLEGIRFKLDTGDFLAVLGPNGGGKSTLIKTLLGTVPISGGEVRFGGAARTDGAVQAGGANQAGGTEQAGGAKQAGGTEQAGDAKQAGGAGKAPRPSIGYVPQIKTMDRSFPARSIELVATARTGSWPWRLGRDLRTDAERALDRAGAAHLAERPLRLLSGGELQRVYLARAMLGHPDILLLDEPEAGVDAAGSSSLFDVVDEMAGTRAGTIVMVTHDWDVARHHASHVLLVNRRQIAFGRPDEALTEDAIRLAFGHVGHRHAVAAGGGSDD